MGIAKSPSKAARKLASLRGAKGLTLRELADLSGVAHSTIHGIEHGDHGATIDTWLALARALDADVGVFVPQLRKAG